ncbi:general secretion pathway protein GspK [Sphingomonas populi]|uniref:Type II secretion system protein K n=1 Tax=Sphingomonas populi TaxID=2484750 RepID=A0A4Q6Y8Z7_9SPHN|nr:general secretion pathway protein GspK [Sphingomonas populi]
MANARVAEHKPSETGAALLTVLLLVAVIAVLAATALERLRIAIKLGGNAVALDQARAFAEAGEALAINRISDLLGRDATRVSLAGGWSDTPIPLPVTGGIATLRITDGGNCFNLNGLVTKQSDGRYVANPDAATQFANLIRLVGAPARSPEGIAAAATDWIDSDTQALSGGAEDGGYAGLETPYRTANTLMTDPSELRAVMGVTPEIYAALRPWLCALPVAEPTMPNVNTVLPEQAPLLAVLMPGAPNVAAVRSALLSRPVTGYDDTSKFWQSSAFGAAGNYGDATQKSAVTTKWFALRTDVTVNGTDLQQNSLIDASTLPARLVSRQWGEVS